MAPLFICGMNIETCTNENPVVYGDYELHVKYNTIVILRCIPLQLILTFQPQGV
jgi:hypothetical protein